MSGFKWNKKRDKAALLLAEGYTQREVSAEVGVTERTIRRWYDNPEFDCEVDRLTLMTGIASKAERLRLCKRAIRQCIHREGIKTKRDLLDWVKHAQGETHGVKLDLSSFFENALGLAGGGQGGDAALDSEPKRSAESDA